MEEITKSVITPDNIKKHTVNKYQFKGIGQVGGSKSSNSKDDSKKIKPIESSNLSTQNSEPEEVNSTVIDKKVLDIIDSILKKSEELAENLKRVESKLEAQKDEFSKQIEDAKKQSYESGFSAGFEDAKSKLSAETEEIKGRLADGINSIDSTVVDFKKLMDSLESELSQVALDIAKEVILTEVNENSEDIAKELAKSLLDNVRGASKVVIKVNPEDSKALKPLLKQNENLNIEIEPNGAIAKGGVVIVSDVGNIDGSVMTRFANIKASIQEVQNSSESN